VQSAGSACETRFTRTVTPGRKEKKKKKERKKERKKEDRRYTTGGYCKLRGGECNYLFSVDVAIGQHHGQVILVKR